MNLTELVKACDDVSARSIQSMEAYLTVFYPERVEAMLGLLREAYLYMHEETDAIAEAWIEEFKIFEDMP